MAQERSGRVEKPSAHRRPGFFFCSIWPERGGQIEKKKIHVPAATSFPSALFRDAVFSLFFSENEAIFSCNLLCLLPIRGDYRLINIACVGWGAGGNHGRSSGFHFLHESACERDAAFLEEYGGQIICCHYLER